MEKRFAVVLAAGQGTRMKSKIHKVMHPILGQSMIHYVLHAIEKTSISKQITIVGHGANEVMEHIGEISEFAIQDEQQGTAHAVMQAKELLRHKKGTTLIVCGDTPLISSETYRKLFEYHESTGAKGTILTTKVADPTGYGRIVRNDAGEVIRIVEQKDATEEQLDINEINTGTFCFDNEALFHALKEVNNDNAQNEYYLTDVIEILQEQSEKVTAYLTEDASETIGINDRVALAEAENMMKKRINEKHLRNGVAIMDPEQTYIGPNVTIEQDVVIYPGSMIFGETHIATDAVIGPNSEISNCTVGKGSVIRQSVVNDSKIGEATNIGPFSHIRPGTVTGKDVRVGNYVEVKKSIIDDDTKLAHLSYIGDATVGKNVNVGCGAITVNYDGKDKYETIIEDDVFVGCSTNLVAPVTLKKGSFIAAGSTITRDVPEESLAIGRARQENKEGYVAKLNKKK